MILNTEGENSNGTSESTNWNLVHLRGYWDQAMGELWWEKHNRVLRGQHLRSQASRRF